MWGVPLPPPKRVHIQRFFKRNLYRKLPLFFSDIGGKFIYPKPWSYESKHINLVACNIWKNSHNFLYTFFSENVEFWHFWAAARIPPTSTGWKLKSRGSLRFEDNDIMGFLCKWLKTWSPHFKMQKHHMRGRLKQELPYFGANSDPHDQAGGWRCRGWRLKFDVFLVSSQKLHGMHTFWMKLTQISARCSLR